MYHKPNNWCLRGLIPARIVLAAYNSALDLIRIISLGAFNFLNINPILTNPAPIESPEKGLSIRAEFVKIGFILRKLEYPEVMILIKSRAELYVASTILAETNPRRHQPGVLECKRLKLRLENKKLYSRSTKLHTYIHNRVCPPRSGHSMSY